MAANNTSIPMHLSAHDIIELLPIIYAENNHNHPLSHSTLRHIIEKQMAWMEHQYQQQHQQPPPYHHNHH
eukprot:CAMPEP_0202691038 /NCGR_PEP_ID=MMETSP1385-20130828/5869_1 /ASSEMBLY_ACC=CAM_ASM_000861 /TAXON_ID=933848 /ORGANISM="Elphidium margaritaceum" /LENGTH=69 /DNA_ID=CAMNT_0049346381 /DNA_START=15 /DNA_END=221 /DNA_ORIENTATION=+